jgi:peptidoglycan hydrolase CwlO-like protein
MKQEMRWAFERWYDQQGIGLFGKGDFIYRFDDMLDALGLDPDAQEKIDEVTEERDDACADRERLEDEVSTLERESEQLIKDHDILLAEKDEAEAELETLKERVAELEKALEELSQ